MHVRGNCSRWVCKHPLLFLESEDQACVNCIFPAKACRDLYLKIEEKLYAYAQRSKKRDLLHKPCIEISLFLSLSCKRESWCDVVAHSTILHMSYQIQWELLWMYRWKHGMTQGTIQGAHWANSCALHRPKALANMPQHMSALAKEALS